MDALFVERVALAFVVAGVWITFVTLLAEKFGSKLGGLVGNMPANIFISMLFIGITQGPQFASDVAAAVPAGMAIAGFFLFTYIAAVRRHGALAFVPAFAVWFFLTLIVGSYGVVDLASGILAYAISTIVLFAVLEYWLKMPSARSSEKQHKRIDLLLRAVFSGAVVASVVAIAAILGPVWGGLAATFPAVMSSMAYIVTKSQGSRFAQGFCKVMLVASPNIVVYVIAVHFTFPIFGIWWGTLVSYICAALFVIAIYPLIKRLS